MRIHIDLGQTELIDPHRVAGELLVLGADRNDELMTYFAGEPTAYPAGRLTDLVHPEDPPNPSFTFLPDPPLRI